MLDNVPNILFKVYMSLQSSDSLPLMDTATVGELKRQPWLGFSPSTTTLIKGHSCSSYEGFISLCSFPINT